MRTTSIRMLVVGLVIWAGAIAWPAGRSPGLLLVALMVGHASFGSMTDE